jgi:hypothetical protein
MSRIPPAVSSASNHQAKYQRALTAPEKFYCSDPREDTNPKIHDDAESAHAPIVRHVKRRNVSEHANNAYWKSERNKHLEPYMIQPFLSRLPEC